MLSVKRHIFKDCMYVFVKASEYDRPFLDEIFAGPFHRAKMLEQGKTVVVGSTPYPQLWKRVFYLGLGPFLIKMKHISNSLNHQIKEMQLYCRPWCLV